VPEAVLSKLKPLKDLVFETPDELADAFAGVLPGEERKRLRELVLKNVKRRVFVEVLAGVKDGDVVLGQGAILLKPVVVRVLEVWATPPTVVMTDDHKGGQLR
jgi:hypothetical protein